LSRQYKALIKRGLPKTREIAAHLSCLNLCARHCEGSIKRMLMKILSGVQGTGNGHGSRVDAMLEECKAHPELDVTWLLSGRPRAQGCGVIPDFTWRRGLSFVPGDGGIRKVATLRQNNVLQFLYDVHELDLAPYDLVVSDYEPVVSHAA